MLSDLFRAGIFCLLMLFITSISVFAQQTQCETIYGRLLENRKGPELAKFRVALAAGKEYLEKCAADPDQEKVTAYVNKQIPVLTETIKELELIERFNKSVEADNQDEIFASGKELLARDHPSSLDIMIVLASVGYNKVAAEKPTDTMNEETLKYARAVLEKINSGAKSDNYGAYKYTYKTKDCGNGAENASGWMNYTIGYVLSARQKNIKDALPYYYRATQTGCETKNNPAIYRSIANWYIDEGKKVEAEMMQKLVASNNEETDEVKALDLLRKGYFDRALDAYARASKIANARSSLPQESKDSYSNRLKDVYSARFEGKMEGFDQFLAKVSETSFPDPMSEVKPAAPDPPKPVEPAPAKPDSKVDTQPAPKTSATIPKAAKKKTTKK